MMEDQSSDKKIQAQTSMRGELGNEEELKSYEEDCGSRIKGAADKLNAAFLQVMQRFVQALALSELSGIFLLLINSY